jgi:hypothetical protein
MTQRPANEHLSAWLDGELDEAEGALLEAELARDPDLRAELQQLEAVVRLLREEGPAQAPLGFHHRVMARVEQEHPERPSWWAWLRRPWGIPLEGWVLAAAAAAALLMVLPIWGSAPDPVENELSPAAVKAPRLDPKVAPPEVAKTVPDDAKVIGRATTGEDSIPHQKDVEPKKNAEPLPEPQAVAIEGTPQEDAGNTGAIEPVDPTSPYQVFVRSDDAKMKRRILAIASEYGGNVTDAARQPVVDGQMRSATEELVVSVPQADLQGFAKELADSGYEVQTLNQGKIVAGTTVNVRVVLELEGGGTPVEAAPQVPASRKAMEPSNATDE